MELLSTSPNYNQTTYKQFYISMEHIILNCIPEFLRRHLQIISQISIGLAIQLVLTKVMARAISISFARVVAKAWQIFGTVKQKS